MDEHEMQDALKELLEMVGDAPGEAIEPEDLPEAFAGVKRVETYESAGVLTRDAGLVITMADGTECQITIVRSR